MPDLRAKLHQSWGWLLALGLVLILFGGLILTTPLGVVTASLTTEIWIAAALVAAGVLQLMHGMKSGDWSHASWQMLGGIISIIGGVLIFVYPTLGLVSLTMIIAITLVAQGITSLMVSGGVADWSGRRWLILSAVISIVAGLLILFDLPSSAGWTLGTIVGAALLLQGVSLTLLVARGASRDRLTASGRLRQPNRMPPALRILDRMAQELEAVGGDQLPVLLGIEAGVVEPLPVHLADGFAVRRPRGEQQKAARRDVIAKDREHGALIFAARGERSCPRR